MRPDILQFNEHVNSVEFQAGVNANMWGIKYDDLERPTWPCIYIWIRALPIPTKPEKYFFKFDLTGYTATAPTACPWDIDKDIMLPLCDRPNNSASIIAVFQSGFQQSQCLYTPLDRLAQIGHDPWKTQHPDLWWKPNFTIQTYVLLFLTY